MVIKSINQMLLIIVSNTDSGGYQISTHNTPQATINLSQTTLQTTTRDSYHNNMLPIHFQHNVPINRPSLVPLPSMHTTITQTTITQQ